MVRAASWIRSNWLAGRAVVAEPDEAVGGRLEHLVGAALDGVGVGVGQHRAHERLGLAGAAGGDQQERVVDPGQKDGVLAPLPGHRVGPLGVLEPGPGVAGEQRGAGGQRPQARGPAAVDRGGVLGLAGQQLHGAGHGAPPHPDQAAQVLDVGVHQGVVGALEGLAEQVAGPGEAPAELGGVGRPQEAEGAGLAHRGEPGGAVERARGRGVARAREGVAGRLLERPGDLLVRLERRGGEVPGPAVGGGRRVEGLGERPVGGAPLGRGGAVVHGRAHQRVAELEPAGLDGDELCELGLVQVVGPGAERPGGGQDRVQVARVVGRGGQQRAGGRRG